MNKKQTSPNSVTLDQVVSEIKQAQTFFVTGHYGPEGDALGSTLGLGLALEDMGKKVKCYNSDPVPELLKFLPGSQKITASLEPSEEFDLAFMVDVGEKARVGKVFEGHPGFRKVICLDHHIKGIHEGDLNFVMPHASATGLVVYHLLKALGFKSLSKDIATNLYCAIATDTGGFRYSNTDIDTFEVATELIRTGVDPWQVARPCFETMPPSKLAMLKKTLNTLTVNSSGKFSWIVMSQKDMTDTGVTADLTEGFISYPRSVEGVEVAVSFRESENQEYKISFRSNEYVDVSTIAAHFGGGGHLRAAGCVVKGNLKEIQEKIFHQILKAL